MNKETKARTYNSSRLQELLDEVDPKEMEKTKVKMQLAARIEDLMRAKGWNKSQFAEHTGKNPSEITKWLSGTHNFTIDILTEIALTLDVELMTLLGAPISNQVVYQKKIEVKVVVQPIVLLTPSNGQEGKMVTASSHQFSSSFSQPKVYEA
ncbi:helix-turn-helix transcriptional regulator [Runella sp. MFBS21]|uniref:helix-turn-helix domain-containing protein n=1 Tax=Runella sp. MFBS21 TaxID=3034018 RepID=UPI0023F9FF41|nr:helix-turn-helix transcriptional regulator [Runella sp. MFBS21]MDF7820846.1 helix-turn-helix transcriptional regulator [Runella sp. MFBS21]